VRVLETLSPVLVEAPWDVKPVDHNLRVMMFQRSTGPLPGQPFFLRHKSPDPSLFFDTFALAYTVTEIVPRFAFAPSSLTGQVIQQFRPSNRVLEDEWPYPQTNHNLAHQFRWNQVGVLRGFSVEYVDLNDDPWQEWQPNRTDKMAALFPFRQFAQVSTVYHWEILHWKSKNWQVEAEQDIDRKTNFSLGLQLFGHKVIIPPVPPASTALSFVAISWASADSMKITADTINYRADGTDETRGGGSPIQENGLPNNQFNKLSVTTSINLRF